MEMKANISINGTVTLNADDLMDLFENGELSIDGVVIGTTDPELERFQDMVVNPEGFAE